MKYLTKLKAENWNKYAKINKLGAFRNIEIISDSSNVQKNSLDDATRAVATFEKKGEFTYILLNNFGIISIANSMHDLKDYNNSYESVIASKESKKASIELIKMLSQICGDKYKLSALNYHNNARHNTQQKFDTVKRKTSQYIKVLNTINNQPFENQDKCAFSRYKSKLSQLLISEKNLNTYIEYLNDVLKIVQTQSSSSSCNEK